MRVYRGRERLENLRDRIISVTVEERVEGRSYGRPLIHPCGAGDHCHSPEGFDWGYTGGAPLELSRWLLADCFGRKWASRPEVYDDFMREVVSAFPTVGWELTEPQLTRWATLWAAAHGADDLRLTAESLSYRLAKEATTR
jgi:hypothetical protein